MAKETEKNEEGLTLRIKIGPKEGDMVGYGKIIVGKEKPKAIDLTDQVINNNNW